jgi:hypothetical protein
MARGTTYPMMYGPNDMPLSAVRIVIAIWSSVGIAVAFVWAILSRGLGADSYK